MLYCDIFVKKFRLWSRVNPFCLIQCNGCNANLERNSDFTTTKLVHVEEIKESNLIGFASEEQNRLSSCVSTTYMAIKIKHMRSNLSPSMCGLPASLKQLDPETLGECLKIVFEYQLERSILLRSQHHSATTLLYRSLLCPPARNAGVLSLYLVPSFQTAYL